MTVPKLFISYSHDSEAHKQWVMKLASDLRNNGIDTILDQWDLVLGQDIAQFMFKGITDSDRVILVCTNSYVSKAEDGKGGVGYERLIVTQEVVAAIDTKKFIPIVINNDRKQKIPQFLGPRFYIDFSDLTQYHKKLEELSREILGLPTNIKPPLGIPTFSASVPSENLATKISSPSGITSSGVALLEDSWFSEESKAAYEQFIKLKLPSSMELRFALHESISKSQIELLSAVRDSQIRTFGWPIGITLDNSPEFKTRPFSDGIRTIISIEKDTLLGRPSFDYWALRQNGDFFLLQSNFEDTRNEKAIFFDTRIIRITESLMFARNLYSSLGLSDESILSIRIKHKGLKDRILTSAAGHRMIIPTICHEPESNTEIITSIEQLKTALPEKVQLLLSPLFMLFDFQKFSTPIYTDIVTAFESGKII